MRGDFSEHFDARQLDNQTLGEIEYVLNSPAYRTTFKPYMLGILNALNKLWKDRSRERADKYPDDFLAGGVIFGEGLIEFFDKIIEETNHERAMAAAAKTSNDDRYVEFQRRGVVKPIVGLDQSPIPEQMSPEEDY